jgi:hypothetical protein
MAANRRAYPRSGREFRNAFREQNAPKTREGQNSNAPDGRRSKGGFFLHFRAQSASMDEEERASMNPNDTLNPGFRSPMQSKKKTW